MFVPTGVYSHTHMQMYMCTEAWMRTCRYTLAETPAHRSTRHTCTHRRVHKEAHTHVRPHRSSPGELGRQDSVSRPSPIWTPPIPPTPGSGIPVLINTPRTDLPGRGPPWASATTVELAQPGALGILKGKGSTRVWALQEASRSSSPRLVPLLPRPRRHPRSPASHLPGLCAVEMPLRLQIPCSSPVIFQAHLREEEKLELCRPSTSGHLGQISPDPPGSHFILVTRGH